MNSICSETCLQIRCRTQMAASDIKSLKILPAPLEVRAAPELAANWFWILALHITNICCLWLCHMPCSLLGDPFHRSLVCRLTAFHFLNNIGVSLWDTMRRRLTGRIKMDYCFWITQGAWMYCTLEVKEETHLWTEYSHELFNFSFVMKEL